MTDTEPRAVQATQTADGITTITISRPHRKNAVDGATAKKLAEAVLAFENDETQKVCILYGDHGTFCAGFDLHEVAKYNSGEETAGYRGPTVDPAHGVNGRNYGPMGPSRMQVKKPVISAVSGYAVAGGLELSLIGDIRIAEEDAVFGVFCRRFGVPLIDGGTVRLQAIIGLGRAMDMILTGRAVKADEALQFGLANRVVPKGQALTEATKIAKQLLTFPQECMNVDRSSCYYSLYNATSFQDALRNEYENGVKVVNTESVKGAAAFSSGGVPKLSARVVSEVIAWTGFSMDLPSTDLDGPIEELDSVRNKRDRALQQPRRLCMSDMRCRLCLFNVGEDDMVVARVTDAAVEEFSPEFTFEPMNHIHDSDNHVRIHACGRPCEEKGEPVPFFHVECRKFKQHDVFRVVSTGCFQFEPTVHEQNRRFTRINYLLARRLQDIIQVNLPAEIVHTIAKMLVHECATITNQEQSLGWGQAPRSIRLDSAVYATYSVIDGVRYVKSLTNFPDQGREEYTLLSKEGQTHSRLYIAHDYRGVRAVKLCPSDAPLSGSGPITNCYWRNILDAERIMIYKDGLTVGNITVLRKSGSRSISDDTRWAYLDHPSDILDLQSLDKGLGSDHSTARMASFECNVEGITGYTVVTDGHRTATVHAHRSDEEFRFYAEIDYSWPCGFFIYMPLDKGEYLTEICRRLGEDPHSDETGSGSLVFMTNKGRVTLFGATVSQADTTSFHKLATPSSNGSQVYINEWTYDNVDQVRYIAFSNDIPSQEEIPIPSCLAPEFPNACTKTNGPWFTSSCSMKGISKITLCRDSSLAHKAIIGMLVEYSDGHRESLGRFRFDKTLEKFCLDSNTDLYVGSGRNIWDFLYVEQIVTSPRHEKAHLRWMKLPRDGTLEWWNSYQHSILRNTSGEVTNFDGQRL
ncbi:unnamed protein product [Fusarium graminearum]|nr:unnamed protein product [Fusarium graminearum]